jgi:hypothetical protein
LTWLRKDEKQEPQLVKMPYEKRNQWKHL